MFAKFKINIEDVRKVNASSTSTYGRNLYSCILTDSCSSALRQLLENEQGIIDGEKLKNEYFPTKHKKEFNVFISHSHSDIKEIERFATILEEKYGVRCFVDSMIWKDVAELVQRSTAHIHSLLSMALFEMIDQCECCIFVQSDNSLALDFNDTITLSPWIYEEIFYMNHAKDDMPSRLTEKYKKVINETRLFDSSIKMSHVVDLKGFKPLLQSYCDSNVQGEDFLTRLYVRSNIISAIL